MQEIDYEKPGLAQHYCVECAKFVFSFHTIILYAYYRPYPLDITRQILHYDRTGGVKFINDGAKLSKNQLIRSRNLSVPQGWVGIINVRPQSSQNPTLQCCNHNHILLQEVRCTLYLIIHRHTQPRKIMTSSDYLVRGI